MSPLSDMDVLLGGELAEMRHGLNAVVELAARSLQPAGCRRILDASFADVCSTSAAAPVEPTIGYRIAGGSVHVHYPVVVVPIDE